MRSYLLCTALSLLALPAAASSIVTEKALSVSGNSFIAMSCTSCPNAQTPTATTYHAPELKSGVVEAKIGDWHGHDDLLRVDRFMGGSPVMTVSQAQAKLQQEIVAANEKIEAERLAQAAKLAKMAAKPVAPPSNVDRTISTAAVNEAPPFDPARLQLRLK